ncbi:hypothetical protein [Natronomonas gomsonensis]|uniref:hypothetical protein n=1 Tax=Natronomonas gomsonensis TaxID=1046043 RepID=UPI0015BFF7A0|nr:hypothetical protein [Natronomonas gomsonensis]
MNVVAEGRYGAVLHSSDGDVLYVPSRQSHRVTVSFADEETDPPLRRRNAPETLTAPDGTATVSWEEIERIEGVIRFTGGRLNSSSKAKHWLVLEDAVGPLRYRTDVENASIHNRGGETRPRVPLRLLPYGTGAVFAYFIAHDHLGYEVSRELSGTLCDLNQAFEEFLETHAPSFATVEELWPA